MCHVPQIRGAARKNIRLRLEVSRHINESCPHRIRRVFVSMSHVLVSINEACFHMNESCHYVNESCPHRIRRVFV